MGASQKFEEVDDWNDGLKTPFAGEKFSNSLVSIELTKDLRDLTAFVSVFFILAAFSAENLHTEM